MNFFISSLLPLAAVLGPAATPSPDGRPDIRPIVPPQPFYVGGGGFWPLLAGVFAGVALVMLWYFRRRKKPAGPVLTPRQIAAKRLQDLDAQMDRLDARAFGGAVADVLREFIGVQYGLHPERQTSEEFLASITGSRAFSTVEHTLLTEFLEGCDLLKFARADASMEGKRRLLRQATDFLEDSAEPEREATPADGQRLTLGA